MNQTTKTRARKGSAKQLTARERAEQIINSTEYSQESRTFIRGALEQNLSNLALLCETVENGDGIVERVAAMLDDEQKTNATAPPEAEAANGGDEREQPHTFTIADCSRMYDEDHYAELLNSPPRIKGLIGDVRNGNDHAQIVAVLTLVHAAASFENIDDRRELCIQVARACMDDVTDVWGALGAVLIKRAATDRAEDE